MGYVSVTLSADGMGDDATEAAYYTWVGYVDDRISERVGRDVQVAARPFGVAASTEIFVEDDPEGLVHADVTAVLADLWADFCELDWPGAAS